MKKFRLVNLFCLIFSLLFFSFVFSGQALAYVAASANYQLEKDSINFSGSDLMSSTNFSSNGTLGEVISGLTGGVSNNASSGYRYMEKDPPLIPGCTDPKANNYNSSANFDDNSCTYTKPPSVVTGCLDPKALNYNAEATVSSGNCIYAGVPNVTNFQAHYSTDDKGINLTWVNPNYPDLLAVIIRRSTGSAPLSVNDGVLVYNGTGESKLDKNVEAGVRYYYTAFVKSKDGRYSSGVIANERVPENVVYGCTNNTALNYDANATVDDGSCRYVPGPVPGCVDPLANNYNSSATVSDGSCRYGNDNQPETPGGGGPGGTVIIKPFDLLPTASTTPDGKTYSIWDFRFLQPEERIKVFDKNTSVRVAGEKNLTILFNYDLAPQTLKIIGVTLTDPNEKNKTFSFLMHQSKDGTAYEATISPLIKNGTYPLDFYIINYDNQVTKHIKGKLIVSGVGLVSAAVLEDVVIPVAASGLVVGFLPSLYDLLVIMSRVFSYFFGRRKKSDPWGTVYDSVTKQPLDPVYLTANSTDPVTKEPKEIASAITDIDGRFGFFLPAGEYHIKANKTHYRFPSTRLSGRESDELYEHLYFGGAIRTSGEEVMNINIPMDPIDFDWNEFAKSKTDFFRFYARRKLWLNRLWRLIFIAGFTFSVYAVIFSPSIWNLATAALYSALFVVNRYWHEKRRPLTIFKAQTGEPMPFSILRVFLPELNQQIKYSVADKYGRFFLLVRPGTYYYTVEEKMPDGTYNKVYQSEVVNLPQGVLTNNVYVK